MPEGHAPFAVFNRLGNPGIRLLLQSPLHGVASRQLALITVTGRRTGKAYTIPVQYRRDGGQVRIGVGWPARKIWWRNLRGEGAPVRMRIRGEDVAGHAVARGDEHTGVTVEVALQ